MCGRYVLSAEPQAIQQAFDLDSTTPLQPRYNIAPTQAVPIITNDAPKELTIVNWGLIPSWSKDPKIASRLINARSETVAEKPSFRAPFKYRRCLIPADGFYEWIKTDDGKVPHLIHLKDHALFTFAGLWEVWNSPDGDEVWTCTILTTDANAKLQPLHHRMPVILGEDVRDIWLDKNSDPAELKAIMGQYPDDEIDYYPVSKAVNKPVNDNPTLIERDVPPQQQSMF